MRTHTVFISQHQGENKATRLLPRDCRPKGRKKERAKSKSTEDFCKRQATTRAGASRKCGKTRICLGSRTLGIVVRARVCRGLLPATFWELLAVQIWVPGTAVDDEAARSKTSERSTAWHGLRKPKVMLMGSCQRGDQKIVMFTFLPFKPRRKGHRASKISPLHHSI